MDIVVQVSCSFSAASRVVPLLSKIDSLLSPCLVELLVDKLLAFCFPIFCGYADVAVFTLSFATIRKCPASRPVVSDSRVHAFFRFLAALPLLGAIWVRAARTTAVRWAHGQSDRQEQHQEDAGGTGKGTIRPPVAHFDHILCERMNAYHEEYLQRIL